MLDFNNIINKLKTSEYNSIDEIIDEFEFKNAFAKAFFSDMKEAYDDLSISLNFMNEEFIKSLVTCLRIMKYIHNSNIRYVPFTFVKDIDTFLPKISVLKAGDGTLKIFSVPNKNIIKYSYAKKMPQGIISTEGHFNLTAYDENTKNALDIIFKMVEN